MTIVPLQTPPTKKQAQELIRKLVTEGKVAFHGHANLRKKQRQITSLMILNCLSSGHVIEEPCKNLSHKGWETAVEGSAAGVRLRIAVCLRWSNDLLVVTAYKL